MLSNGRQVNRFIMLCSSIEVVITGTTGNRVTVKSRPRVRIPPAAPNREPLVINWFPFFSLFFNGFSDFLCFCFEIFVSSIKRFILWLLQKMLTKLLTKYRPLCTGLEKVSKFLRAVCHVWFCYVRVDFPHCLIVRPAAQVHYNFLWDSKMIGQRNNAVS